MATATEKIDVQASLDSLLEQHNEELLNCVHCGLCLPSCPTYRVLGNENDSPRGRIYLMRRVVEGQLRKGDAFISHIDLCLGCRACETVCPSGVPYGRLLEAARVEVAEAKRGSLSTSLLRFTLNQVFTRPRLLGLLMALTRRFRDSALARLAFDSHLVKGRLHFALALLLASRSIIREQGSRGAGEQRGRGAEERGSGGAGERGSRGDIRAVKPEPFHPCTRNRSRRPDPLLPCISPDRTTRVALLRGCVMEGLFAPANRATRRVLARNGCQVIEAEGQMCCGALHSHAGEIETARRLARKNIEAFDSSGCDAVIVNSAGCGAAMKEYGELLAGDSEYAERAHEFASKVRDISEFLIERKIFPPTGRLECRVAYDAPCHLLHAQRIAGQPVELLKAIPGIEVVPLRDYETCCGGAGIYNLQHAELSADILSKKIESILESRADTVATANPGCIMQIGAGLLMDGLEIDVVHPVELLDAAYDKMYSFSRR